LPQAKAPARHLKTDADLARTLVECYAWLSALATDYLARLYAPFWNDLPAQLACVSWRALDWALLAWELDGDGATTITQHSLPPALGAGALLGDALCLHLHIETLVASLPARLAMRPRPNPPYRRPGGLRTSQFLSIYSGLSSPDAPRGAAAWLAALNSLIRSSPLTRAVYADLVGFDTPPAGRSSVGEPRPQLWAWLADLPVGIETDLPSTGTLWGNQLWYSHLARSLLGALISQPAAFDALLAAEERLRQLEGRSRGRSEVAQPWPTSASADLEAIRRQCDELRHRWAAHIAERLAAVGATLRATQGAAGMPYVHLRLLDMLVRHVTTASMHGMLGEWHKVDPAALPRPGDLFDTGGACFRTLQQLLLGQTLAELVELLDNDHRYMLRSGLQNLLNPAGRPAAEDLAAQASVPEEWAGYLIARFFDGPMELPLIDRSRPKTEPPRPLLNREGPSPARLLADEWLDVLLRHLPLQSVTQIS
jgi:hypothetical protein